MSKLIKIYTDGSSIGNPGPGGYGIVMLSEDGEYKKIILWLKNNIHSYGRTVNSMKLVRNVTGEELTSKDFINHLRLKIKDFS